MHAVVAIPQPLRRAAFAVLAAALLGSAVAAALAVGGWWQIPVFWAAPDLALLAGMGRGLERGQLHPRAVRAYNLLHRVWGPLVLGALVALGALPATLIVGALAWGFHIALDRAAGYGLRGRDGFQRG